MLAARGWAEKYQLKPYSKELVRKAVAWNAKAQCGLAYCYFTGQGVPKDYTQSLKWFRRSAEQGDAGGQYGLGFAYCNGMGVTRDYTEGMKWVRQSAEQGHAIAQLYLGYAHTSALGVPQDFVEAAKWLRMSAMQGNAGDQRTFGLCLRTRIASPTSSRRNGKAASHDICARGECDSATQALCFLRQGSQECQKTKPKGKRRELRQFEGANHVATVRGSPRVLSLS